MLVYIARSINLVAFYSFTRSLYFSCITFIITLLILPIELRLPEYIYSTNKMTNKKLSYCIIYIKQVALIFTYFTREYMLKVDLD